MCRCADHLLETFSSSTVPALPHSMPQRSHQITRLPRPKKEVQRRSPLYCAPTLWNSLLADLQKLANWNSVNFFFFFEHDLVCFQHLTMIIPLRSHGHAKEQLYVAYRYTQTYPYARAHPRAHSRPQFFFFF